MPYAFCRSERTIDAYHLLRNSPTKSILSNSQHSTPQRTVCLNHPLNQPQSPNKPCTPTHSNHRHITTTIPPNQHFIQIRPTNIDNVAINVQAPTHPNHLHCPVINSVQYDFPTTMPSATHPIYVQQQEANGRFCLVPATSLSLSLPFPPPPVAAIQTMPTSAPQANPIKSAALHSYQFIQMPSNQAILLDKSQRNSHPSMNNQQFHTATVHGKWNARWRLFDIGDCLIAFTSWTCSILSRQRRYFAIIIFQFIPLMTFIFYRFIFNQWHYFRFTVCVCVSLLCWSYSVFIFFFHSTSNRARMQFLIFHIFKIVNNARSLGHV